MNITKKLNSLLLLVICLIVFSCKTQRSISSGKLDNCFLKEMELSEFKISTNDSELANKEFNDFFMSKNKYDILKYSTKGGEKDYKIERWFFDDNETFKHIVIFNGVKLINKIRLNENDLSYFFKNLKSNSIIKVCVQCSNCESGLLLLKNEKSFFKYYHEGDLNENLSILEKEKIIEPIQIYTFLKSK